MQNDSQEKLGINPYSFTFVGSQALHGSSSISRQVKVSEAQMRQFGAIACFCEQGVSCDIFAALQRYVTLGGGCRG